MTASGTASSKPRPNTTGVVRRARAVAEGGNGSESIPRACFSAGVACSWMTNPPSSTSGSHTAFLNADRKSTRLNSSHSQISYAVFCLKKKKNIEHNVNVHRQPDPRQALGAVGHTLAHRVHRPACPPHGSVAGCEWAAGPAHAPSATRL